MPQQRAQLVCQHLENISREMLAKYPDIVRSLARGRHGIYALYRKDRLYYLGLATNLRQRLKQHLRDQHARTWDRFSLYLTVGDQHLYEIESLFLRISKPRGNTVTPGLARSDNLLPRLRADIRAQQSAELEKMAPRKKRKAAHSQPSPTPTNPKNSDEKPALAGYFERPFRIRFPYNGKTHVAKVRKSGNINYGGNLYHSPSQAAKAVAGRPMNGWACWRYQRAPGEWVPLYELRKR